MPQELDKLIGKLKRAYPKDKLVQEIESEWDEFYGEERMMEEEGPMEGMDDFPPMDELEEPMEGEDLGSPEDKEMLMDEVYMENANSDEMLNNREDKKEDRKRKLRRKLQGF